MSARFDPAAPALIVLRRVAFFALVLLVAAVLEWLPARALVGAGSLARGVFLACFLPPALWFGVCAGNALPGFLLLIAARDPARAVLPVAFDAVRPIATPTALLITVRNEDMAAVLASLRPLLDGLSAEGAAGWFEPWILSDTMDAARGAAEARAVAAFPYPVRYRRRTDNAGFKAGNVMDFLDHDAGRNEIAVILDADSRMSAGAVLRLVRILQAAPRLGLVQHLTVGLPAAAPFPRLFQFGMRAGMRVWAIGQAWWQADAGPYWGHNAAFRIAPFRAHCRLAPLASGRAILSHDQVEAARLGAAGWGVAVWAGEDGSQESNPPALPEFLARDTRWLAGNLQYRELIARPGLRPMGRWQLGQAMLMFAVAPCLTLCLALAVALALAGIAAPPGRLALALAAAFAAVHSPKLLGYAAVLLSATRARRYGGRRLFAQGAATEILFTLLLDPITTFHRTLAMARLSFGHAAGWGVQNRGAHALGWGEAVRRFWPHTAAGVAAFALLAGAGPLAPLWAAPFAGGLVVAIPFAVVTSGPRLAAVLAQTHIGAIPEELAPSAGAGEPPPAS